jgi:4-oxalocrotonate tautomerase
MPFIQIHMAAGRSEDQKRALLHAISDAVHESIGAPVESIRVWINEFDPRAFITAGVIAADKQNPKPPGADASMTATSRSGAGG